MDDVELTRLLMERVEALRCIMPRVSVPKFIETGIGWGTTGTHIEVCPECFGQGEVSYTYNVPGLCCGLCVGKGFLRYIDLAPLDPPEEPMLHQWWCLGRGCICTESWKRLTNRERSRYVTQPPWL